MTSMLNDDAFAQLVAEDVKNRANADQREYLRRAENLERWRRALNLLIENLDTQIEEIDTLEKADIARYKELGEVGTTMIVETQMANDDRRKRINRFRFYVEQRLAEADRRIALGDQSSNDPNANLVKFLQRAIEQHRDLMEDHDLEPTAIDEALWASLDGRWLFGEVPKEIER